MRPSISLPEWMDEEVTNRRTKESNRSKYIREALLVRFALEDADQWDDWQAQTDAVEPVAD